MSQYKDIMENFVVWLRKYLMCSIVVGQYLLFKTDNVSIVSFYVEGGDQTFDLLNNVQCCSTPWLRST
jgi:hypothetical protein